MPTIRCTTARASSVATLSMLACLACATSDPRPVIQNASSRVLELRSEHQDGHTLNVILQPGTQVWLGDTAAPVREIQGQREGERVLELDHTRIESCLAVDEQRCMGWKVSDSGSIQVRTGAPESE